MTLSVPSPSPVSVGDVRSEVGTLRRVLVHRPGRELDRLTRSNAADLLFDEVPWPELAREEHDALTATLRDAGVEVLYLEDLLAGALRDAASRTESIALAVAGHSGAARGASVERLAELGPAALAAALIAGDDDAGLPPSPNQMFVRDTSAWLGRELVLGAIANPVRRPETNLLERIYKSHPAFAEDRRRRPLRIAAIEGGDLFCLDERTALVGVGSRSAAGAVEALAGRLFTAGFTRVLVVEIPAKRSSIHLDCLMTLVDTDALLIDRRLLGTAVVELLPPDRPAISRIHPNLPAALAQALGVERMRVIEVADEREQWTLGANTLAVGPARVVAYSRNARTNEALATAGIEVLAVPGEELSRGRGGPRCLTCPLARDPAPAAIQIRTGPHG